ncbi:50S ribosomal protein L1 [Desulfurispirillum indicum]|uniref:Large ribosomal subunit protein uL1 n=1 Tax=Desulfurispirillum indicum (strain ATCC BAA-1389 / DSM 22839 / S5) TaxID=653733 RepID=E6W247_DESIS|nr:50S ribosomal protein L1 [Desulfurispirillum indicum]ADU66673.1 ribosomal protein L1 [Desulfurispirillum indicum S5]UCZ55991.1 50S ribosomal protein L1 [Desulfurispirillum indicum]
MGKKFNAAVAKVDKDKRYTLEEALELCKSLAFAGFSESVDVAVNLGVNPRHADQIVRGSVSLPHGTGKDVRVLVFAKGEKEKEARDAGADYVGSDDLAQKITGGWLEFDKAVATPDLMGLVGKLGRILGPRSLMPNPKLGTVTFDVAKAVKDLKSGMIEYRTDKAGIIHAPVGKVSFELDMLRENVLAIVDALIKAKPATAKGTYVRGITLSSTMGPGIRLDVNAVLQNR